MWELQPLSNNRRTTKISLLLGENTSLTLSQIPHNFMGLLSLFTLSSFSLTWCTYNAWMHCLFIGKHPCKSKWQSWPSWQMAKWPTNYLYILPLEDFDDLIKSSHLIICDSSILSILAIFMLLTFLLGYKRICTIYTYQC